MKRFLYRIFCGFFLGVSVFAPGFSGSVIAIIMGIYHEMITIISNPFKNFKKNFYFCLPLGIGMLLSAILFINAFNYLFENYEKATYFLFVGLIAGNLPSIIDEIKKVKFKKIYIPIALLTFAGALTLSMLALSKGESDASSVETSLVMLGVAGLLAGMTTLVPGMSVSMVLIMSGVYGELIFMAHEIQGMNFDNLTSFAVIGVAAVIGLLLSAKLIKYTFARFPGGANSAVLGFMCGSLAGIIIESIKMESETFSWWLGGVMLGAGLLVSMLFVVLGKKFGGAEE